MAESKQESGETGRPDGSEPSPERQQELRAAYEWNVAAGRPPYKGVRIRTHGELLWVMHQPSWPHDLSGADLQRVNLTGADYQNASLSGASLRYANLSGVFFGNADLSGAELSDANLERADLDGANLSSAQVQRANLGGAKLGGAHLRQASFKGADLHEAFLGDADLNNAYLDNANLARADLGGADLTNAHLENAHLQGANLEETNLRSARLNGADLSGAKLRGANLESAELKGTNLAGAKLSGTNEDDDKGAILRHARLERANLSHVDLQFTDLTSAYLAYTDLSYADLRNARISNTVMWGANLSSADLSHLDLDSVILRGARMDAFTVLTDAQLGAKTQVADVVWNNAPLSRLNWDDITILGDELRARSGGGDSLEVSLLVPKRNPANLQVYQDAAMAYRQVATALRDQGLSEHADRFAYRAQVCQRRVHLLRLQLLRWQFSVLLNVIAGYGYRPLRTLFWYLAVIGIFAFAYFQATHGALTFGLLPSQIQPLPWYEALVLSVSSFHGRGFFQPVQSLGDPIAILAAIEAVFGLFIEVSFIATFTQRYFGK